MNFKGRGCWGLGDILPSRFRFFLTAKYAGLKRLTDRLKLLYGYCSGAFCGSSGSRSGKRTVVQGLQILKQSTWRIESSLSLNSLRP